MQFLRRKKELFFLLIFFSSCTSCPCWKYKKVSSDCFLYNSGLLHHQPCNLFSGIEIEFLKGSFGTIGYASVYCRDIPNIFDEQGCEQQIPITFKVNDELYFFQGTLLEGNQRLLLSTDATEFLIDAFLNFQTVCVFLSDHYEEISPIDFTPLYQKFSAV